MANIVSAEAKYGGFTLRAMDALAIAAYDWEASAVGPYGGPERLYAYFKLGSEKKAKGFAARIRRLPGVKSVHVHKT